MAAVEPVVLAEYEQVDVELPPSTVHAVAALAGSRLTISPTEQTGRWTVRAGSHVGTIAVDDFRLLIRPKVTGANFFHMLEAGGDALDVDPSLFDYAAVDDLVAAFATFYARLLERTLARGISRRYVAESDRLVAMRGRFDVRGQIALAGLPLPVACTFDEHTPDVPVSRVVRAAAERLLRVPRVVAGTRQLLGSLIGRLDDVGPLRFGDVERSSTLDRLDAHYGPVLRLARLVLSGSSITDAPATFGASSFLVDMNVLFEQYVEASLRRALRGRLDVVGQRTVRLDDAGSVRMRPDLLFSPSARGAHGVVYVGDAKYKLTSDGFGREADYYQLLAYLTALDVDEGVLVYCRHDGSAPPREVVVRHAGRRLMTYPLSLLGSPAAMDREVAELAEWIAGRSHTLASRRL